MQKTILVTGATDGIGFATVKMLAEMGHTLLLHGRNPEKLAQVTSALSKLSGSARLESYTADLSRMEDVKDLGQTVARSHERLDVLINNAGVFVVSKSLTQDNLDVRFAVNTIAPYLLTRMLLPLMDSSGRVINLSSAAQAPMRPEEMIHGNVGGAASTVYAQSKLALTMWTRAMAQSQGREGPAIIAVNPKSFLDSKMVRQAYGTSGSDLRIGAEILCKAALSDAFADASGQYFDNDIGAFTNPHPDALNPEKCEKIVSTIEEIVSQMLN